MDLRELPRSEVISGFSFVATQPEISAIDMLLGPTRPMLPGKRGGRRVLVRDNVIPHRYQVWFLDVIVSAISPATPGLSLELVGSDGAIALYRLPPRATDILSEFTPERADFVGEEIAAIANRAMDHPEVAAQYKVGGVRAAVHLLRGDSLKAVPRREGKEVFYWCYRTADHGRLRVFES